MLIEIIVIVISVIINASDKDSIYNDTNHDYDEGDVD